MYSRIIPSAFSIKKIGTLTDNLLGLIQPLLKVLSRYSYRIYNSFYKKLQMGIYGGVQPSFKLIIQLYLKFYSRILASSSKKNISILFIYFQQTGALKSQSDHYIELYLWELMERQVQLICVLQVCSHQKYIQLYCSILNSCRVSITSPLNTGDLCGQRVYIGTCYQ